MMKNKDVIFSYLDELIPNPKCELEFFNDYSLLIAIMLSAQTKDSRVNQVTKELFHKYPTLDSLARANLNDIKDIIKPLGNYNKKALNVLEIAKLLVNKYDSKVPKKREILETFPGVGRKTVNVFYVEYLNIPAMPVDTHVERVSKRLGLVAKKDNVLTIEKKLMKIIKKEELGRRHQQLVLFGRYFCTSKKPSCNNCKLKNICKK